MSFLVHSFLALERFFVVFFIGEAESEAEGGTESEAESEAESESESEAESGTGGETVAAGETGEVETVVISLIINISKMSLSCFRRFV
jgi:hypothetical protein